jgi:hypothetical protein
MIRWRKSYETPTCRSLLPRASSARAKRSVKKGIRRKLARYNEAIYIRKETC